MYSIKSSNGLSKSSNILNLPFAQPNTGFLGGVIEAENVSFTGKTIISSSVPTYFSGIGRIICSLSAKSKVETFNKFINKKPSIKITLTDGSEFKRVIDIDDEGKRKADQSVMSQFRMAPFILRRNNILQFWTTEETKRQVLFFNYHLHDYNTNKQTASLGDSFIERIKELEEERLIEKQKRREARGIIAKIKNIDESAIPLTGDDFYSWIRENILHGMSLGHLWKLLQNSKEI
jgi:hypothetical protein